LSLANKWLFVCCEQEGLEDTLPSPILKYYNCKAFTA